MLLVKTSVWTQLLYIGSLFNQAGEYPILTTGPSQPSPPISTNVFISTEYTSNSRQKIPFEMTGKSSSSRKHQSSPPGSSKSGDHGKSSRRHHPPSEKDEIITFRKYLNYDEANRLNRKMDKNAENLDRIEDQLRELDAKLQKKRGK